MIQRQGTTFYNTTESAERVGLSRTIFIQVAKELEMKTHTFAGQGKSTFYAESDLDAIPNPEQEGYIDLNAIADLLGVVYQTIIQNFLINYPDYFQEKSFVGKRRHRFFLREGVERFKQEKM